MRINANKKIHKLKRDPYRLLLRMAAILAITVAAGIGIYYLCSVLVVQDYQTKKVALEKYNVDAEQEFNAKMNALRSQGSGMRPSSQTEEQGDLAYWETTIGESVWRVEDKGRAGLENTSVITMDRATLLKGGLMLVNAWHALPQDYIEADGDLVSVGTSSGYKIPVQDNSIRLFPNALDALTAMLQAAKEEANLEDYIVREAYRSMDTQTELFNAKMEELSDKYSGDILIEQAKRSVNYPGTSEYQSGMSFRMDVYNRNNAELNKLKFQQSDQGKWMTENSWKYGVIFRFPTADFPTPEWEDKSYKTGVSTALSLYRYVGKAHAVAMRVLDYCLEEYVEFLIDHPHLCIYKDGGLQYEIFRIPSTEVLEAYDLPIPNPASDYQASLDNMDGVVLAYTYGQ
ncbi:MAG: M15 family metallopeptidase [Candidatus Limiplasma sp.]|nr:M15 family metallopeptidase [Candidatus Limiplasma sp.]